MPRDVERACDATKSAPVMMPDAPDEARPELNMVDRPPKPAPSKMPAIPVDPELLRYRHRLDQQLVAWRSGRSATSLANALAIVSAPQASRFEWHTPSLWIASIAACAIAGLAGWWVASAPAVRISVELAETRQALQQEKDKVQNLGAALAATWHELDDRAAALADKAAAQNQERDALQQALQQSEAAAANFAQSLAQERDALHQARQQSEAAMASFAQSLAQERDRNQQLEQQLATRRDAVPEPVSPAAEPTSDKPPTEKADPDVLRLMARASLLVIQGDIGAARIVLERAAEFGSAAALFALAETFDPAVLSAWGTVGTQGDAAQAGDLYAKALAGGVAEAKDRLATLRR
jgi:tetratricopeptide (TPR) repeat protein